MTRWTRRGFLLLLPVLLLPWTLAPARQDAPVEKKVRLGTWNIEWLGNPGMRKKAAQKPEDIAKYIMASKVDLLGLNEITTNLEGETLGNKTLIEVLAII